MDMTYQPKHRKRRGNYWTPWIHLTAVVSAYVLNINLIRNNDFIVSDNHWFSSLLYVGAFFLLWLAFAIAYSVVAITIDSARRSYDRRVVSRYNSQLNTMGYEVRKK
jgi:uncharacterized membrane protein YhaH (DUF805 family)